MPKPKEPSRALDSNCLTYFIEAGSGLATPAGPAGDQKLALYRLALYQHWGYFVTETVKNEVKDIPNIDLAKMHESWLSTLIDEVRVRNPGRVNARTEELAEHHSDANDCRIVAECEDAGLQVLLSNDDNLIKRLGSRSEILIIRPLEYWESLAILSGARPTTVPHHTNPLAQVSWWKW